LFNGRANFVSHHEVNIIVPVSRSSWSDGFHASANPLVAAGGVAAFIEFSVAEDSIAANLISIVHANPEASLRFIWGCARGEVGIF